MRISLKTLILVTLFTCTKASPVKRQTSTSTSAPQISSGITYSPYQSSGGCKDASQVLSDMQSLASSGYSTVRIYGTDCDQVNSCLSACATTGQNLLVGVFDMGSLADELTIITSACGSYGWGNVITISIGNELVNSGQASADQVVSYCTQARSTLRAAGYTGPVVAVDTFNAILNNPTLCQASDYVAANAHCFFDGNTPAASAGQWVQAQIAALQSTCGKSVLITESGWPSQGQAIGNSVPSLENQQACVASLKASVSSQCLIYTAWNNLWQSDPTQIYWGVLG